VGSCVVIMDLAWFSEGFQFELQLGWPMH